MNKPIWGSKPSKPFAETEPASTIPLELASDADYDAPTQPAPLAAAPAPAPAKKEIPELSLSLEPVGSGEEELMAEVRKDNRVAPLPTRWLEFYRILEDAAKGEKLPAPPLTGSAWAGTPDSAKRMCFMEQAEWAVKHGVIAKACEFLMKLPKNEWHYGH